MRNKLASTISLIVMALAGVALVCTAYMLFVPVNVLRPETQPYKIETKVVHPGDTLVYLVDACKYKDVQGNILRRFIDEEGLAYPVASSQGNVPIGCSRTRVPLIIPGELHPGVWYLSLDVSYQVNPLKSKPYHLKTETFTIIE